jgi:hypothetical protein
MEKFRVFRRDALGNELTYIGTYEAEAGKVQDAVQQAIWNDPINEGGKWTYVYEAHDLGNAGVFQATFRNERFTDKIERVTNPDANLDPSDDTPVS